MEYQEYRGFQVTQIPSKEFKPYQLVDHIRLAIWIDVEYEGEVSPNYCPPLRFVTIDWKTGILEDDPLHIEIQGTTVSTYLFADVFERLHAITDINREHEPTVEMVVKELKNLGIVDRTVLY